MSEATFEDRDLYAICLLEIERLEDAVKKLKLQDNDSAKRRPRQRGYYPSMQEVLAERISSSQYPQAVNEVLKRLKEEGLAKIQGLHTKIQEIKSVIDLLDICPVCKGYGYDATHRHHVSEGPNPYIPSCDECGGRGTKTGIKKQEEWKASIPKCDFSGLRDPKKPVKNPVLDEEIQM